MEQLLIIREYIRKFVSKNETYIIPTGKFLLSLVSLILINSKIGYANKITNFAVTVILSLVCSFLPANFIVLMSAGIMLLHLYSLSLECVIVVGVLLILMYLLYFRFSPKDTILLLLTPVCFALKMPYVIPISAGLVSSVSSVVSVGSGVVIYYILSFINANEETIRGMDAESLVEKIKFLIDELLFNKEMMVLVIGFAVTIILVNIIRRLSVDHSWTIAIIIGTLSNIVIVLAGDLKFGTYISVLGLILGSIVALIIVSIIKFFVFNVDYSRTEKVQFEDDDYYYYVKAVPKNNVKTPVGAKREKRIEKPSENATATRRTPRREDVSREHAKKDLVNEAVRKNRASGNKTESRRIIHEDEDLINGRIVRNKHTDGDGMTGIERAAAAKARANRKKSN